MVHEPHAHLQSAKRYFATKKNCSELDILTILMMLLNLRINICIVQTLILLVYSQYVCYFNAQYLIYQVIIF